VILVGGGYPRLGKLKATKRRGRGVGELGTGSWQGASKLEGREVNLDKSTSSLGRQKSYVGAEKKKEQKLCVHRLGGVRTAGKRFYGKGRGRDATLPG